MLNDINNGTRKLPVMTAIPQLGGARAESLDPDLDINDNRAVVNKMAEDFKEGKNQEAAETPAKKSFGQRIRGMFS